MEQTSIQNNTKDKKIWSLDELKTKEVKEKYSWTIIKDKVYDVKKWMMRHPGGDLVIFHCLYKDATCQFTQFHPKYVEETLLESFYIGDVDKKDVGKLISHSELSKDFVKLDKTLHDKGYFQNEYNFYYIEVLKVAFLITMAFFSLYYGSKSFIYCSLAGALLALGWHQLAFVGHDTGHNGITGENKLDHIMGIFIGNLVGGISIGWWKDSHYVHHVITNDPEHDPDIQHLPFLAVSTRLFTNLFSTYHKKILEFDLFAKFVVRLQHYLFYLIMMFGRFNLYVQSIKFMLTNRRCRYRLLEISSYSLFFLWYITVTYHITGYLNKFMFVFCSHAMSSLLHVQITISHFSMDTEVTNEDEEFFKHQLRTTMDVDCPEWLDWLHGGLQFQAVHHLFPRMPRKNLRKARDDVLKLCDKYNVKYFSYSFFNANITVLSHLKSISEQIK